MKLQIVIRILLGVGFAAAGFFAADRFLTISDPNVKVGVRLVLSAVTAAFGVILVPIVSEWVRVGSTLFARRVAHEVISQMRLPNLSGVRQLPGIGRGSEKKKKENSYINPVVVDTSALIDGRMADIVESGFFYGTLIIPQLILSELQHIADASNALRRGKGRRGLDILERMKKSKEVKTIIYNASDVPGKNIDEKLLRLAKALKAKVLTHDFNLNKVGTVSGIKILNVNELVNALKTTMLPGEPLEVKVLQEGKEKTQGVGYLQDGTMIVVEDGAKYVGKTISTKVLRVLQTAAGRMIFVQAESQ